MIDVLEFLEDIGVEFDMDWDNTVSLEVPEEITTSEVLDAILSRSAYITEAYKVRAYWQRAVFVGGSMNGLPHRNQNQSQFVAILSGHNRWECYKVMRDDRAFFIGTSRSRKKALAGIVRKPTTKR